MNSETFEQEHQLQSFIAEAIRLVGGVSVLADIAGVSVRTVYAWKKGERFPSRANLHRLTMHLNEMAGQIESSVEIAFPTPYGSTVQPAGAAQTFGSAGEQIDNAQSGRLEQGAGSQNVTASSHSSSQSGAHDAQSSSQFGSQPSVNASEQRSGGQHNHVDVLDEFVFVDKAEARPSAGGGSLATSDAHDGRYAFRLDWVLHKTRDVNQLKIMEVMGRSMESTLHNGDLCLVNEADKTLVEDRIYVVRLGDEIYVKRFSRVPGKYLFRGDNRELSYQDIDVDPRDESVSWEVIGRVIWAGKDL